MAWDRFELTNFLQVTVVLGAQWGDEGKGKVVDMLATKMDVVCRCQVSQTLFFFFCRFMLPRDSLFSYHSQLDVALAVVKL